MIPDFRYRPPGARDCWNIELHLASANFGRVRPSQQNSARRIQLGAAQLLDQNRIRKPNSIWRACNPLALVA